MIDSNEQREALIAQALDTPEGRSVLAQSMVEPYNTSLMYQAIGKKLLLADELPASKQEIEAMELLDIYYPTQKEIVEQIRIDLRHNDELALRILNEGAGVIIEEYINR